MHQYLLRLWRIVLLNIGNQEIKMTDKSLVGGGGGISYTCQLLVLAGNTLFSLFGVNPHALGTCHTLRQNIASHSHSFVTQIVITEFSDLDMHELSAWTWTCMNYAV